MHMCQDGLQLLQEIKAHDADPSQRGYPLESVKTTHLVSATLETEFVVMTPQEYLNEFGGVHKCKDPKLPTATVSNLAGHKELVYIFRPDHSYRRLRLSSMAGDVRDQVRLRELDHMHQHQGSRVLEHVVNQRLHGSNLISLLAKNPCVSTISEFHEKLRKRKGGSGGSQVDGEEAAGTNDGESDVELVPEKNDSNEPEVVIDDDGQPVPQPTVKDVASEYATPDANRKRRKIEERDSKNVAGIKRRGSGTWRSGAGSSAAGGIEESEADAATSKGKPPVPETPQVTAHKWLTKLDVQDILNGKKLGVSMRHASNAAAKLPVKEKLLVNARLKVCAMAAELAPENLACMEKDAILAAVQGLESFGGITFPLGVQVRLWETDVQALVSHCINSMDAGAFTHLWERILPVAVGEALTLDLHDPHLCCLQLPLSDRCAYFNDVLNTQVVLHLVLSGELRSASLKFVCKEVLAKLEVVLLESLPDELVALLFDIQICMTALEAICSESWSRYADSKHELEMMKSGQEKSECMQHLLNAIGETTWYSEKQEQAYQALRTLKVHEVHLSEMQDFLGTPCTMSDAYLGSLCEKLRFLPSLLEELPSALTEPMTIGLQSRVLDSWEAFVSRTEEEGGEVSVSLQLMQNTIADAAICFGQSDRFQTLQEELAQFLVRYSGSQKVDEMWEALLSWQDAFLDKHTWPDELGKRTHDAVRAAQGCPLEGEKLRSLTELFDRMLAGILAHFPKMAKVTYKDALEILTACASWINGDELSRFDRVQKLCAMSKLREHLESWEMLGATLEEQLQTPACWPGLVDLMGCIAVSREMPAVGGWGDAVLEKYLVPAREIVAGAQVALLQKADEALRSATVNAQKVAGGMSDASLWDQGLPPGASFTAIMEKAKSTLLKREKQELETFDELKNSLEQAYVFGLDSTDKQHDQGAAWKLESFKCGLFSKIHR